VVLSLLLALVTCLLPVNDASAQARLVEIARVTRIKAE